MLILPDTDVWVSMGEPDSVWEERIRLLNFFQINMKVIEKTGNPSVRFLHCLPAFHNRDTKVGEDIYKKWPRRYGGDRKMSLNQNIQ